MKTWRWPQWAMIGWWALWIGMSAYQTSGGSGIEGWAYLTAWFGVQIFLMERGGFWK